MLNREHIWPLTRFVDELAEAHPDKDIPYFDPLDGGIRAQCLFVLESPGKMATREYGSGFISRDNNDESAKNFLEAFEAAKLPREKTVSWNIVPWDLNKDGRGRTPSGSEIEEGLELLYLLIARLPCLRAIVLVGQKAQKVGIELGARYRDIRVFACPHPSPQNLNTNSQNRVKIINVLTQVKEFLDGTA